MCRGTHVEVRGKFQESVLTFLRVGLRERLAF